MGNWVSKNIRVKDIAELLFKYGHIDNRNTSITKKQKRLSSERKQEIKNELNLKIESISYILNKEFNEYNFSEFILLKDNSLYKIYTPAYDYIKIDEQLLHSIQNEMKLYSYIYMKKNNLENITNILIFENKEKIREEFSFSYNISELTTFFEETLTDYLQWYNFNKLWITNRDISIKELKFPFPSYRPGQLNLMRGVYATIAQNQKFFIEAPTGSGKSISTLFPAIKSLAENKIDKIFYLTAKTIGAKVAEEAIDKMVQNGLKLKFITITAKEKVCFCDKNKCNPIECKYANNYYGKVNSVILEMLNNEDSYDRNIISDYAKKYEVCPFELSLDLSLWMDVIICDYNYVFDPKVYLKRYFENNQYNCTFLIDEAHNLLDRAREMYSASINKDLLLKAIDYTSNGLPTLHEFLSDFKKLLLHYENKCVNNSYIIDVLPHDIIFEAEKVANAICTLFKRNAMNKEYIASLGEFYRNICNFIEKSEYFDESYVFYIDKTTSTYKLFCINPVKHLKAAQKNGKSTVFFSATLNPLTYFRDVLGGDNSNFGISLESPFDTKNRALCIYNTVSTKYKDRDKSYENIVEIIHETISAKTGNYFAFLPSFDYMLKVKELFKEKYPNIKIYAQKQNMCEFDREAFIDKFFPNPKRTTLMFAVTAGIFSEGIDLVGDRLIGAIIVGVGLPMISVERELIKEYYTKKGYRGFDYSYTYPGFNKILQSAGRVIRTDEDKGVIVLVDDRFTSYTYKNLFPKEWKDNNITHNINSLRNVLNSFWIK